MNALAGSLAAIELADLSNSRLCDAIDEFVARQDGSVLHQTRWLMAVEEGVGATARGLVARRALEIVGWLPLSDVHSPIFGRALVSSGFAVSGGILAESSGIVHQMCLAAEELARRLAAPSIELRGGSATTGWHQITGKHANFAAPLAQSDDDQLLAIPRKARAEVRKGLNNEFVIAVGRDAADRAAHYAVYAESVRNLGTPVFPRRLFAAVLDRFGGDADILTVRHEGKPVASVLSLYHRGTVMPFWGGGTWAARALRANERMYYELMCHARRRGCTRFDFGRSKTGSGPYSFKKNWGFEPEPLSYWSWSADAARARNIDPTDAGYSARIELWKRLPLPIANRIGPWIARGLG